jgi:Rrf2 family protein
MLVSRKCQYALRAVFELALRNSDGPVKIHEIARSQDIPVRFLEIILNQLKHAGFVQSRRGKVGGYILARVPQELTVGQIVHFVQGPLQPVDEQLNGPARGNHAFQHLWTEVEGAVQEIYDKTTIEDLVKREMVYGKHSAINYAI